MTQIRLAQRSDVPALNELIAESARELSRNYYSAAQTASLIAHVFGVDTQLIDDGTYYAMEDSRDLVACGGWSARNTLFGGDQAKGSTDSRLDPRTDAARIRAFFVHPDFARRGFGAQLLVHCEYEARSAGFQRSELMATLPGEPFYLRYGYRPIERTTITLPDGVEIELVRMGRAL